MKELFSDEKNISREKKKDNREWGMDYFQTEQRQI